MAEMGVKFGGWGIMRMAAATSTIPTSTKKRAFNIFVPPFNTWVVTIGKQAAAEPQHRDLMPSAVAEIARPASPLQSLLDQAAGTVRIERSRFRRVHRWAIYETGAGLSLQLP